MSPINSSAQLQATDKRLVLDLFDRRWEVVQELRSAIAEMMRSGVVPDKNYWDYVRATQRAPFLFGPEVTDHLETVRKAMIRHVAHKDGVSSDNDALRARAADAQAEAFTVISDFYERFDPLIRPYMQMHQKLPP
jgi:hypothetical protein